MALKKPWSFHSKVVSLQVTQTILFTRPRTKTWSFWLKVLKLHVLGSSKQKLHDFWAGWSPGNTFWKPFKSIMKTLKSCEFWPFPWSSRLVKSFSVELWTSLEQKCGALNSQKMALKKPWSFHSKVVSLQVTQTILFTRPRTKTWSFWLKVLKLHVLGSSKQKLHDFWAGWSPGNTFWKPFKSIMKTYSK